MRQVIIIGGGIAGLSTAYYLQKQAAEAGMPLDYTLIETEPKFGGKITTTCRDGFVIEGGPDSFITQKPWALELARELGLSDRLLGTNDERRKVYVLTGGRLVELPDGVMLVVPTKLMPFAASPLISWPGKLRMGLDLIIPARQNDADESLADFIRRRLGQEALDKIAEPLMAGIHVADPERLSLQATFPRFIDIEQKYGSLIRGMLAARRQRAQRPKPSSNGPHLKTTIFMSLRGGLTELVDALVDHLERHGTLLAGRHVERVRWSSPDPAGGPIEGLRCGGTLAYDVELDDGTTLKADAVVLATPAFVSADLVEALNPELANGLRQIRYVSTATVSLGFHKLDLRHPLDGFGFVIPSSENRKIAACTWTSTKFDHRVPDGHVLLRAFVGGAHDERLVELDDDTMVRMVRDELADIMGVTAEPTVFEVFRWEKGNPQYDVGHPERVAALEAMCDPGIFLAGSAYHGVGLPDCVRSGEQVAGKVVGYLGD